MKKLKEQTKITPHVSIEANNLIISGNCYPFDASDFWNPIMREIIDYQSLNIEIDLNHINTNSIFYLTRIFKLPNVKEVYWICDDIEDEELAGDINEIIGDKIKIYQKIYA